MEEKNEMNFEEAFKKLSEIVEKLENEDIKLEEAMKLYEEGVGLVRMCQSRLENAERRIKTLSGKSDPV